VPALLAAGLALFGAGALARQHATPADRAAVLVGLGLVGAAWLVAVRRREAWWPRLRQAFDAHTQALDALPRARLGWWIALASGAGLFVELLLIRWHAVSFLLFCYYKNVTLLACFLGLGAGYAMAERRPVMTPLVLPAVGLQFLVMYGLGFTATADQLRNPIVEQLAFLGTASNAAQVATTYGFLVLTFVVTVLTAVPLGHLASRLMRRTEPLVGYAWNLGGSLAGIALFSLLSHAWSPPTVWLLVAAGVLLPFLLLRGTTGDAVPTLVAVGLTVALLSIPMRPGVLDVYSPYQILSLNLAGNPIEGRRTPNLQINHMFHQHIMDLAADAPKSTPQLQRAAATYEMPFRFKPRPGRVLIVGSGAGNDVAGALRAGAGRVDAVEIDPAILEIGLAVHAERPYQDPRVEPIVDDARGFMRRTDREYDIVVFGLLGSFASMTGMSSVRLDSFVYTIEAFREARTRLAPGGVLAITIPVITPEQGRKVYLMLEEAFDGQEPRVFPTNYSGSSLFVTGPGLRDAAVPADLAAIETTSVYRDPALRADVSTDDWPFIYMPERRYPATYAVMIVVLVVASWLILRQLVPAGAGRFSAPAFFLGAGFMLVETKGITELALTFGSTWEVVSAVIAGVLVMAFLANLVVMRWGAPHPVLTYGLLGLALGLGWSLSGAAFAGLSPPLAGVVATAVVTLPLFFSGFAFSGEVRRAGDLPAALSSNLFGSLLGGPLEYNSMYFGLRSLYVLAGLLYACAFVASLRVRRG
jgi:SAM-dependent methyltransferase